MTLTETEDAVARPSPITKSSSPEFAKVRFVLQIFLVHVRFCNRRAFLSPSANQFTSNSKVQRLALDYSTKPRVLERGGRIKLDEQKDGNAAILCT
ncbi:uncharacterized protein LOC121050955 isoform X2 [Rosa chinensis]|uniref:uncharacterized protein LOC121050955 isoform X2 n=1 Tax=Rosa chinensis TaxID=74649 RepID=UPI001AD8F28A|nr:uncharacterized protein LOC121050955 isoform X2 [Rosa chinensis]